MVMEDQLYFKQIDLQKMFDLKPTFCCKICRLIDDHDELYSEYSRLGRKYHGCVFLHAYKHWEALEEGKNVPPFEPELLSRFILKKSERDADEAAKYAEHRLRTDIIVRIVDWFNVTAIPNNICNKRLAGIIKKAMVAIVTE